MTATARYIDGLGLPSAGVGWALTRDSAHLHLALRLRTALGAGLGLAEALRLVAREPRGLRPWGLGSLLAELETAADAAEDGEALPGALAATGRLRPWEIECLETGSREGRGLSALEDWADVLRMRATAHRLGAHALAYPLAIALVGGAAMVLMSLRLMPPLLSLLGSTGRGLPRVSLFAMRLASGVGAVAPWSLLLLLALGLVAAVLRRLEEPGRRLLDSVALRRGGERTAARVLGLRAAAASLAGGGSEAEAFRAAGRVQPRLLAREAWEALASRLEAGEPGPLTAPPIVDAGHARSLRRVLAEADAPAGLRRLAEGELRSRWRRMERFVAVQEPLLVSLVGLFVGLQLLGWWAAIFRVTSALVP